MESSQSFIVYRGTQDIVPDLLGQYYDGEKDYLCGKGMYFALNIKEAEGYANSNFFKFGIIARYEITINRLVCFDLNQKNLEYFSNDLETDKLAKKMKHIQNVKNWDKEKDELLAARNNTYKFIDNNFDAVLSGDVLILKNPGMIRPPIDFTIFFKNAESAELAYSKIRIGELVNQSIVGIPFENASNISIILNQLENF